MRGRRHQAPIEDTGIDLAPMLDFVLNLLIFFIITNTFIQEAGIRVNRPTAATAQRQEQNNIVVAVSKDGQIWIDKQHVDIRTLRAIVQRLRVANPNANVIIQADQDARAGLMVEAMDQARLAGVKDVSIAATPKQ